jgi:hypothetical protein
VLVTGAIVLELHLRRLNADERGVPPVQWWEYPIIFTLGIAFLSGLIAPFAATILGIVAMREIKDSKGRLVGFGLAFFDAVFFPVLLINAAILAVCFVPAAYIGIASGMDEEAASVLLPLVIVALPVDILLIRWWWRAAVRDRQPIGSGTPPANRFPWNALWIGFAGLASVLSVISFAMYWVGSPWPLLGVVLPWFAIGLLLGMVGGGDKEVADNVRAVYVHVGLLLVASAGLIAYGVVLSASGWPLWAAGAFAAAFIAGGAIGYSAATDAESTSHVDPTGNGEGEQTTSDSSDSESSDTPGGPMVLVGTIATINLVSSGGDDLLAWLRGGSPSFDSQWQFLLVGPVVVLGGMAMLQRRAYWLAIVASVACVPLGLGSENVVVRLIPLALGLYSLYWLIQPEAREAFRGDVLD